MAQEPTNDLALETYRPVQIVDDLDERWNDAIQEFGDGTRQRDRGARQALLVLRDARDKYAPFGEFKDWCERHGVAYKAAVEALGVAFGDRIKQATGTGNSAGSLLPSPEEQAAERERARQEGIEQGKRQAAKQIKEAEAKASKAERERAKLQSQHDDTATALKKLKLDNVKALKDAETEYRNALKDATDGADAKAREAADAKYGRTLAAAHDAQRKLQKELADIRKKLEDSANDYTVRAQWRATAKSTADRLKSILGDLPVPARVMPIFLNQDHEMVADLIRLVAEVENRLVMLRQSTTTVEEKRHGIRAESR
jgi:chromosome segregation ATPase